MSAAVFNLFRRTLVATLPADLDPDCLERTRVELLHRIREARPRAVILDASAVDILDPFDWQHLVGTLHAAALLGAPGAFASLHPGVVAALVTLDAPIDGVRAFGRVEEALLAAEEGRL